MPRLADVVGKCTELRPSIFDADQVTEWINDVEKRVVESVLNRARGNDIVFSPYVYAEDSEKELYADEGVYLSFVFAKEDYVLGDIARYNNDAAMAEAEYSDFAKRYRREHMPK